MLRYRARGGFAPVDFEELLPLLNDRKLFLIFDRDGTLVPYATESSQAVVPNSTYRVIWEAGRCFRNRVAIVSARGLDDLKNDFGDCSITLAGNYGLEISFASGVNFVHPSARHLRQRMTEAAHELRRIVESKPSIILDNHIYSLCLHFHLLPVEERIALDMLMAVLEKQFSELHFRRLPTSYEVLPSSVWTKSDALNIIADELDFSDESVLYLAFGDSEQDESMYRWANSHQGLSFNVGSRDSKNCLGRADSPDDVVEFVKSLIAWCSYN